MKKEILFDVPFAKVTLSELIYELEEVIKKDEHIHLHTVNVDHLVIAHKQKNFKQVMKNADIIVADGMPIVWYSKLIRKPLPERITGVDLSYLLCEKSAQSNFKLFFLGAKDGVGNQAKVNLEKKYPGVQIVGVYSPTPAEINDDLKSQKIVEMINDSGTNVLLVALGAPKQEYWISKYLPYLKTNINIGVGATLDFMSGNIKRAPVLFQKIGLEWLYRLCSEPKRLFKRYIINDSYFIVLLLKDLLKRQIVRKFK